MYRDVIRRTLKSSVLPRRPFLYGVFHIDLIPLYRSDRNNILIDYNALRRLYREATGNPPQGP